MLPYFPTMHKSYIELFWQEILRYKYRLLLLNNNKILIHGDFFYFNSRNLFFFIMFYYITFNEKFLLKMLYNFYLQEIS